MRDLSKADANVLHEQRAQLAARYDAFRSRGLKLDMTRGKPCPEQLDLALGLLDCVRSGEWHGEGDDERNYGGLDGIPEVRRLFGEYLGAPPAQVVVGGNASLELMHGIVRDAIVHGVPGAVAPWGRLGRIRFLCPSPGYDRHFFICEYFGIEMVPVAMDEHGPCMDEVEHIVAGDETVKGMWCVPKYSNPTGCVYSDEVVERLAAMRTRAPDFRILWDDAYAVHGLHDRPDRLANILDACARGGHPDRAYVFGSTSKVSFAGGGVAAMAASPANIAEASRRRNTSTIGGDKINQLRHVRFFRDMAGIEAHMRKHAAILRPKFEAVQDVLARELDGRGIATWTRPRGGYFVSLDVPEGCAREVVQLARDAGVKLTPAGATWPCGKDPRDTNIRIAPSFPAVADVRTAMEIVAVCTQLTAIDRRLAAA